MSSKLQHHNVPLITLLREMVTCSLGIVVHKNVRLSEVIVSDILDSDHLPVVFHFSNLSNPVDKFTDWERYQSLASKLI
jgi:hypothetical protein